MACPYSTSYWKYAADKVDSRLRGNDDCFAGDHLRNDTTTQRRVLQLPVQAVWLGWGDGKLFWRLVCSFTLAFMLWSVHYQQCVFAMESQGKTAKVQAAAIDINKATALDLQKLPGIGPSLARQIVAYRDRHGPFQRVEDLMAINGIGFKKWKMMRPYLRVVGER